MPASDADDAIEQGKNAAIHIIDMGSFTQLQTAVQLTGLLPSADGIGFVRDHELIGQIPGGIRAIDAFFMHLKSAAEGRSERSARKNAITKAGF